MLGLRSFYKVLANVVFTTNTVLATIGLTSPIAKNEKQNFRAWIPFTLGATGGFKCEVLVPAGFVKYAVTLNFYDTVGGILLYDALLAPAVFGDALTGAGTYWAEITGYVKNGINAGTIDIQVAQNSSDALSCTILEGGYMDVIKS